MSKPSVPQPASPQTTSAAQTDSNVNTAIANATLGNVNQVNPFSSTTYQETGGKMVDGRWVPSFTQTTALNPTLQKILTGTEDTAASLVPVGGVLAKQASDSLTTPLNFSGINNDIIQRGPQATNQNATDAIFKGSMALLQPGMDLQKQQLEDQLSRQGIPVGSPAYNSAMTNLAANQGLTTEATLGNATQGGIQSASNMFNMALQGQNQNLTQQQLAQLNPLSNLKQLYSATSAA